MFVELVTFLNNEWSLNHEKAFKLKLVFTDFPMYSCKIGIYKLKALIVFEKRQLKW